MENAVDALKIAFAMLVFVLAITLTFSVVGQARQTSDIILQAHEIEHSYEYTTAEDYNTTKERIVGFETIIPTIYRYAKEQYAVTIIGTDGVPIVRFDLYTEGFMGNWNDILKKMDENAEAKAQYEEVKERLEKTQYVSVEDLNDLYAVTREGKTTTNNKKINAAPWTGSSDNEIIKRINCDMSGEEYIRNNVTYKGKNLMQYKDKKFIEKFIEVQTSGETIIDSGNSLETIKGNYKLEIIYIMQ